MKKIESPYIVFKILMIILFLSFNSNLPLSAQSKSSTSKTFSSDGTMYIGVDYYPEHWTEERWEYDIQLMKKAGFNVVRLAEFSWSLLEPEEGRFEFDWLDEVLGLLQKYDIKVILGTPTAVMPAWVARKYPETLAMKPDGTRIIWGGRKNNCFSNWDKPGIKYDASCAADIMRGLKKQNFWIMEQTAGPFGWGFFSRNPRPGEIRNICFQQLAHGADAQIWFRWRTCTAGRE